MLSLPPIVQLLMTTFAGWVNRQKLQLIEYLQEENRALREMIGDRRLRFTDDQRRRLAAKAKRVGRKALQDIATIVTPDTLLRWHRDLMARKWGFKRPTLTRTSSSPPVLKDLVRMLTRNTEGLFARIERWTDQSTPADSFWRTISKDNITPGMERRRESRIFDPADPRRIFSSLICSSYDDKGNAISYEYQEESSAKRLLTIPMQLLVFL